MSSTDPSSEETLFSNALALPESARAAYLDQVCGGDATRRAAVDALLRAHQAAGNFLPTMTGVISPAAAPAPRAEEKPGDRIGRYKLLQKIGEGGCGLVYMAEQEEPIRRRVALKVIKLGMDTKAVVARFDAERQALAMMEHPNIAKVLDAGTTDSGRPFFVMELVRGIPVTKYCDEQGLPTEQRLELFGRICHALQHAHQKGIIHRDLKPSNILVTLHDGIPVPKVIDFGIAKATQGKLTDHTYFTAFEQFMGTPAYMSPEQAEMSGLDIDTRSDIYSLGILLYELLAGRPPFDPQTFRAAGLDEVRRLIREVDPPRPSARLSTLTDADRTIVAKQRGTAPTQLSLELAGDLDWIVMRCLEKDRTRRYPTPLELVADIERHLRNEPVIARPPSTGYLLRKLMRRHRLAFGAGTAVAVSLVAGLIVSWTLLMDARRARDRAVAAEAMEGRQRQEARNEAIKSTEVARFMKQMLKGVGPSVALGRDTKLLRDILEKTGQRIDVELAGQPAVAADLGKTLGEVYLELGDAATAEPLLRAAVAAHRTVFGNQRDETAAVLTLWGQALRKTRKPAEAEKTLQEALAIRTQLFGEENPLVADTLAELAWVQPARGIDHARTTLKRVLAMRQNAFGDEHPSVADAFFALGRLEAEGEHDHVLGASLHAKALAMRRQFPERDDGTIAESLDKLGFSYAHELDRQSDAAKIYGEAFDLRHNLLGDQHPLTLVSLLRFAGQKPARQISPETIDIVSKFVTSQRKQLPVDSVLRVPALLALASLEDQPGRDPAASRALAQEAQRLLDQALANRALPEDDVVEAMAFFAWSKFIGNAPAEGWAMGDAALQLTLAGKGRLFFPAHILAWVCVGLARHDEAVRLFETAGILRSEGVGNITLVDVAAVGAGYRATNRLAEAHEFLAAALARYETSMQKGRPIPPVAFVRCQFGQTLLREGRFAEAEATLRKALAEYKHPALKPLGLRMHPMELAMSGLGQALAAQGKFEEAEALVLPAFQELQANQHRIAGDRSRLVREAHDAVIALYTAWGKPDKVTEWKAKLGQPSAKPASPASLPTKKT